MVTVHFGLNYAGGVFAKHPRKRCCALPCGDGIRACDAGRGKSFYRPRQAVSERRTRNKGEATAERLHLHCNEINKYLFRLVHVFDKRLIAPCSNCGVGIGSFIASCAGLLPTVWLELS